MLFICDRFKNALQNSEIEDNNRICVSESLETFWENTPHDSDVSKVNFYKYVIMDENHMKIFIHLFLI